MELEQNGSVLLTQVRETYFSVDCGMSYCIRLQDGRFLLIDSGMGEYDQPEHLLELLERQSGGRIPEVAAWFFTHPHDDHIRGFVQLMERYPGRIRVDEIVRQWPQAQYCLSAYHAEAFDAIAEKLSACGTRLTEPQIGQTWDFPGCRVEMLFICDALYPEQIRNLNDSSLIFRTELCGHTALWLGDCQRQSADWLCEHCPPEKLQCEFLQVGHHGYGGGSDTLYRMANPRILLWPCPDFWFHTVREQPVNRFLIESPRIEKTLVAGQGEYTFELTPERAVLLPETNRENGKMLYHAPIEQKSICALGWSCLTGGKTGYAPLTADFQEQDTGIRLSANGEAVSVCALVLPGSVEGRGAVELHFAGRFGQVSGRVGLLWDSRTPTVWDPDAVLWLDAVSGRSFDLHLTVDPDTGCAVLRQAGLPDQRVDCRTNQVFGFHLCMESAEVVLYTVDAFQI